MDRLEALEQIEKELRHALVSSVPSELATFDKLHSWADRIAATRAQMGGEADATVIYNGPDQSFLVIEPTGGMPPEGTKFYLHPSPASGDKG